MVSVELPAGDSHGTVILQQRDNNPDINNTNNFDHSIDNVGDDPDDHSHLISDDINSDNNRNNRYDHRHNHPRFTERTHVRRNYDPVH